MDNWDELRTAWEVVRHGTVSGAAQALGVHHATVIRHVDALERRLGVKLFQRHARGYTPTEAALELAQVAKATEDQFGQLAARLSGQGSEVSGELIVTTLPAFTDRLMPIIDGFLAAYPAVQMRLVTSLRLFRLEYGEAHVALRAGPPPTEPDNVARRVAAFDMGLYAAPAYIARHGDPRDGLAGHRFVGPESLDGGPPINDWLRENVAAEAFALRSGDLVVQRHAVRRGLGLGFMAADEAEGLTEILPARPEWRVQTWLVTHVDLNRTPKVQAFTRYFREHCQ